jgi:hypothetical protein
MTQILYDLSFLNGNDWRDFATVKRWKSQLTLKSRSGSFPEKTWKNVETTMPRFLSVMQKTSDELIEEALSDNEFGEMHLSTYFSWLKKQGVDHNSAIIRAYGIIRGFYKHNKITTQGWHTPRQIPKGVEQTDADLPLFLIDSKTKKLDLNRVVFRRFLKELSSRDEVIALCLISTGLDDGDLLKLTLGFVREQDPSHERIFISNFRLKTMESVKVFFSKEATKRLREYVKKERADGMDVDVIFTTSLSERKKQFKLKYKKEYHNLDYDLLNPATPLSNMTLANNFRKAAERMGVRLQKTKQSPLRPKRLRKVFRDACQAGMIGDDMANVFMGKADRSKKVYLGKSREELEIYYEMLEPFVTVFSEKINEDEILKIKLDQEGKSSIMQRQIENLQDQLKRKDDMATNAILDLQHKVSELEKKSRKS